MYLENCAHLGTLHNLNVTTQFMGSGNSKSIEKEKSMTKLKKSTLILLQ
jgi:hypothetical protein